MFEHRLHFVAHRRSLIEELGRAMPARSTVEITAIGEDLTEAWRELLTRLPSDVYGALKQAIEGP